MNKDKEKAVIFDCDGVMFDSRSANEHYYNSILSRFNLAPMTPEQKAFIHMSTVHEAIELIFKGTDLADDAHKYRMIFSYLPFIRDMVIEPGLKPLLEKLKPAYALAVATNRSSTIGEVLSQNSIQSFFDIVVSASDVIKPKPDPESVFKILDFLNMEPRQAYYVGDSSVDCLTARASGVIFIAYKNKKLDSDYHVNSMMELSELFDSI